MEFPEEKNQTKSKIFSRRYLWVLVFFLFLSITFFPTHNISAAWPFGTYHKYPSSWWPTKTEFKVWAKEFKENDCSFLDTPGKCLLLPLFKFSGTLLEMSGTLFVWIIDVDNIKTVLTSPALYKIWTYVRDLLNMTFIMVLLFSAFCTIFQIEQYNYKKLLWKIVLMALLVNFSFPITRFIIDASNILMYSVIKSSFFTDSQAQSSLGKITENSALATLMSQKTWPDAASLIGATVMLFMLAITFLAIGVLLLIRIIALAILIIFSPIAFVGTILPGASSYASKWWDNLFKYSFFGPIMIIGVAIAVELMNGIGADLRAKAITAAGGQAGNNSTFIGSMVFILVPIILLWLVMGIAQQMSIAGAGAVMGAAQKAMKWTGRLPWRGIKTLGKKIDRDYIGVRGTIQAWKDRTAELEKDKVGSQTARGRDWLGKIFDGGKRDPNFYRNVDDENLIVKYKKEQDLVSTTDVEVMASIDKLKKGKQTRETGQRIQAYLRTMAEKKDLNEFEKLQKRDFTPYGAKDNIHALLESSVGEKGAVDALHDLEDINLMSGVYSLYGLTHVITEAEEIDKSTGKVTRGMKGDAQNIGKRRKSTDAEQKAAALIKMQQIDYQKFMINFHRDTAITEDSNGKPTGLSDIGMDSLKIIEDHQAKYADRLRVENKDALLKAIDIEDKKAIRDGKTKISDSLPNLMRELKAEKKPTTEAEKPKIEVVGGSFSSRGDQIKYDVKGNRIV